MLTSKKQKREADEISSSSTVIGISTTIIGTLNAGAGNLRIEGTIEGDVNSQSKVVLGNDAKVNGNIVALNADVEGHVVGNITVTDVLVLKANARISGNIETSKLVIEQGVQFNGNCKMDRTFEYGE